VHFLAKQQTGENMSPDYEIFGAARIDLELNQRISRMEHRKQSVPSYKNESGRFSEEILKLIGRVFLKSDAVAPRVVIFSAVERSGSSRQVCAQVAEALASHVEGTVCMIDAHPPSPYLRGQTAISEGGAQIVTTPQNSAGLAQSARGKNLWFSSAYDTGSGLILPERLKGRLAALRADFSYVLIDMAPINESADTLMLGRMADGMILVLDANSTRRAAALRARQSLDALDVKILGAVLCQRTYPIPEALYKRL
jgi:protein-tyrosine kinase